MRRLKSTLYYLLIVTMLVGSISFPDAAILTGLANISSSDEITSDRFRTAEDLDNNSLYGSIYRVYVDYSGVIAENDPQADNKIKIPANGWGSAVFLRNGRYVDTNPNDAINYNGDFNKDTHFVNWALGGSDGTSLDSQDTGSWLPVSKYKLNWSTGKPGEIIVSDAEKEKILTQIATKSATSTFNNVSLRSLLAGEHTYSIVMYSAVLINMPVGVTINGRTFDYNDSVWFTYNQFYDFVNNVLPKAGYTTKQIQYMAQPLFYLFSKENVVNGVTYDGNMAVTLHTKNTYTGYGETLVFGEMEQKVYPIHLLKDTSDGDKLKLIDIQWSEYGDYLPFVVSPSQPEMTFTRIPSNKSTAYGFEMTDLTAVAAYKGYLRYFNESITDMTKFGTSEDYIQYLAGELGDGYDKEVQLGDKIATLDLLADNTNMNGFVNSYPSDGKGWAESIDPSNKVGYMANADMIDLGYAKFYKDDDPLDISVTFDSTLPVKYDKVVVFVYEGIPVEPQGILLAEQVPMTPSSNPAVDYIPADDTTLGKVTVKGIVDSTSVENSTLPLDSIPAGDATYCSDETLGDILAADERKAVQIVAIGYDETLFGNPALEVEDTADLTALSDCDVRVLNNGTTSVTSLFTKTVSELLTPVADHESSTLMIVYDNTIKGSLVSLDVSGAMKPWELTKKFTAYLSEVSGTVSLPTGADCGKRYKDGYHADGTIDWDTCDESQTYDWTGDLSASYTAESAYSYVGDAVVDVSSKYLHKESDSTSAKDDVESITIPEVETSFIVDRKAGTNDATLYLAKYMTGMNNASAQSFLTGTLSYPIGLPASAWDTGTTQGMDFELVVPTLSGSRPWEYDECNTHRTDTTGSATLTTTTSASARTTDVDITVSPFYSGANISAQSAIATEKATTGYYRMAKTGAPINYIPAIKCDVTYDTAGSVGSVYMTGVKTRSFTPVDVFEMALTESTSGVATTEAMWSRDAKDAGTATIKAGSIYKLGGNNAGALTITVNSYIHVPVGSAVSVNDTATRLAEHTDYVNSVVNSLELQSYSSVPYNYTQQNYTDGLANTRAVTGVAYSSLPAKYKGQAFNANAFTTTKSATTSVNYAVVNEYNTAYGTSLPTLESTTVALGNGDSLNAIANSVARLNASMDKSNSGGYYVEHFPAVYVVKQSTTITVKVNPAASVTYLAYNRLSDSTDTAATTASNYASKTAIGKIPAGKFGVGLLFKFKSLSMNNTTQDYLWYSNPKIFNIRGNVNDSKSF